MINDERLQTDSCLKQQENQQVNILFFKLLLINDFFLHTCIYISIKQISRKKNERAHVSKYLH
jgi:hypothetical protein